MLHHVYVHARAGPFLVRAACTASAASTESRQRPARGRTKRTDEIENCAENWRRPPRPAKAEMDVDSSKTVRADATILEVCANGSPLAGAEEPAPPGRRTTCRLVPVPSRFRGGFALPAGPCACSYRWIARQSLGAKGRRLSLVYPHPGREGEKIVPSAQPAPARRLPPAEPDGPGPARRRRARPGDRPRAR